MKRITPGFLLIVLFAFMVSCEKTAIDGLEDVDRISDLEVQEDPYLSMIDIEETPALGGNARHRPNRRQKCFKPVFPLTLIYPDGTEAEVADSATMRDLLKKWKEDNPNSREHPNIAFPHDVMLKDATVVTVESREDVKELLRDCRSDRPRHDRCFTVIYPLSVLLPDGTQVEAANNKELKEIIRSWHENNPDSKERPEFVFPIDVQLTDSSIITVESKEDFHSLIEKCKPSRPDCFSFVFPVSFLVPGGDTIVVQDKEQLHKLLRRIKSNRTDKDHGKRTDKRPPHFPPILFPQDVVLSSSVETVTLENNEQFRRLLNSCRPNDRSGG